MAQELLDRGEIGLKDLAEWPALTEFRADSKYPELVANNAAKEESEDESVAEGDSGPDGRLEIEKGSEEEPQGE
jgi:hypothetical protein